MRICKPFRCAGVALFLFISAFAFSQVKVNIEIEGNGVVCVQDKSFQGAGIYEFEVEEDIEFHFRIKPGKQFYLDSLLIGGGMPLLVSRGSIFAERDDTLHYYKRGHVFRFVFREVLSQELSGYIVQEPYVSRDGLYCQVYNSTEWMRWVSYKYPKLLTISIQNDLEMNKDLNTACLPRLLVLKGNNKIVKGIHTDELEGHKCISVHVMDGIFNYFHHPIIAIGCTWNGERPLPKEHTDCIFKLGKVEVCMEEVVNDSSESRDCINFGDLQGYFGNYSSVFRISHNAKNLVNWGSDNRKTNLPVFKVDDTGICVSNVFNFGTFKRLISIPEGTKSILFYKYFNDKNLVPNIELPSKGAIGYNLESRQLIDSAYMRNLMGDDAEEDFIFEDGFYPRLRNMDERPGRLAASPILLYPGENADNVALPFYVDTNYGVRWRSLNEDIIKIEGNVGYVRHPVLKGTTVRVEAWKEDFNKHVYLTVPVSHYVYQDLLSDTVCPGDSVKMINSYAKNEGWNYEVVETASAEYDTIYRMFLHHLPTYNLTYTDSCYPEELPYRVEDVLMENFGNKTERYVTTAGCDSVREYSLSRRWRQYRVHVEVKGEGFVNVTDTTLREGGRLWLDFTASACNKLDSLKIDGWNVSPQSRYLLQNLHGDCEVEAVFGSAPPAESVLRYEVCGDSLPIVYEGDVYGEGEHEIWMTGAAGCDSVLRLQVQIRENTARIAVVDTIEPPCGTSEMAFSYNIEAGSPRYLRLMYDAAALSAGFRDTTLAVASTGQQTVHIALPPTARPDRYGLRLRQADGTGCYATVDDLVFEIPYPSDIIVQKWSDVLAVLSAEYNGGYEFSGYQWYKNGEPMEGETRPYLYVKPYLRSTDTYAALLERASDGLKLQTCGVKRKGYPKAFSLELLPNPTSAGGEVQVSVNGKPEAEGTVEVFDGLGKPVYQRAFLKSHTLRANWQPGSYVVRVHDGKGKWIATGKLLVQ